MDEHGFVYDYTNGFAHIKSKQIHFNGYVQERLEQNPIRILRYFRLD